jgi:hypothetical protein
MITPRDGLTPKAFPDKSVLCHPPGRDWQGALPGIPVAAPQQSPVQERA